MSGAATPYRRPLTQLAQERIAEHLKSGDIVIDATAGNGHDTLFLAQQIGPQGRVFAFDIQQDALNRTAERLAQAGAAHQVTLLHTGHQHLAKQVPADAHGKIKAVMFNLGYLPGSDKAITTRGEQSSSALRAAAGLLAPGGLISVLAYRGHAGGREETESIESVLAELAAMGWKIEQHESPGPVLFLITPT